MVNSKNQTERVKTTHEPNAIFQRRVRRGCRDQSSEGESVIVGQECLRLRPFKVGDVPIHKAAVRVLRKVREEAACCRRHAGEELARHQLPSYDAEGQDGGRRKLRHLRIAFRPNEKRLQDLGCLAALPRRRDIMSVEDFKNAVCERTKNECAATESDFREILSHAKSNDMLLRGQEPAQSGVCPKTVRAYEQTSWW